MGAGEMRSWGDVCLGEGGEQRTGGRSSREKGRDGGTRSPRQWVPGAPCKILDCPLNVLRTLVARSREDRI